MYSLRRRFIQNQEDCTFTLLALLPTLSSQILTDLDVEQQTHDLQQLSRQNPSLQIPKEDKVDLGESVVSLAGSSAGSDESKGSSGTSGDEAAGKEEKERKMEELKNSSHESWSEEFRMREERSTNLPKVSVGVNVLSVRRGVTDAGSDLTLRTDGKLNPLAPVGDVRLPRLGTLRVSLKSRADSPL